MTASPNGKIVTVQSHNKHILLRTKMRKFLNLFIKYCYQIRPSGFISYLHFAVLPRISFVNILSLRPVLASRTFRLYYTSASGQLIGRHVVSYFCVLLYWIALTCIYAQKRRNNLCCSHYKHLFTHPLSSSLRSTIVKPLFPSTPTCLISLSSSLHNCQGMGLVGRK